ncbi:tetratricopeptide repeat protein 28 isoform X2 [Ischnura elegans]|uniref:tetratricopeptide repeat protein 28 isoform X2 n=1 Tax=Ischnura elegans TaxID=197161 RepID=UPI001ED88413|nr:tetratricopeptide repeat protein 28 isoform X2 [Ischnura elegans]
MWIYEDIYGDTMDTEGGASSSAASTANSAASSSNAAVGSSTSAQLPPASRALFAEKVRASNAACQAGDYATALALYSDALALDPHNHVLLSNRSAALIKMGLFARALEDAVRARELNPKWPKAYYRQGVALQCLGRHAEALAAFSSGLAQDPKSTQLLSALVEAAMKSPLRATLEPTFRQLENMKLDKSPFVVISVVGQELLAAGGGGGGAVVGQGGLGGGGAAGQYAAAVTVLEAALSIGTCSLKLRGSVFSALSSAYWALNSLDEAIGYMQRDLAVAKALGDIAGECRAHGNLGSAHFSKGSYREALTSHRYQLVLAMKCRDTGAAAAALTSLGHVYAAVGDYPNALASHKQCVQLVRQMGDRLGEARETGNVGAVYLAMGDFDAAVDCHARHLRLARALGNRVEEARAYSNLGSSHHHRRDFARAIAYHERVLRIARELGDRAVEARAYAGLGHAARCMGDLARARRWHERQLDLALAARDRVAEGRACSNLGIVYQLLGDHDAALKLHRAHLGIARALKDRAGEGRAYGNMGNAHSAAGQYERAVALHRRELAISREVGDRASEAATHGNLAVAYQALGAHEMALLHYRGHLSIARELKDAAGEACALLNLGNCHSSRGEFAAAVPYYESHLMLSQELHDVEGEAKACHFLGYAHYCLGNFREAVRYYDQDLALARDLQDRVSMGRAYCNLGLAHLALGNHETALECQKYFLAIAHMTKHLPGKFRALGNMGDALLKMGNAEEAVKMYGRQLALARGGDVGSGGGSGTGEEDGGDGSGMEASSEGGGGDRNLEAAAYGALGLTHRLLRQYDKALGYHTQELTLRQEIGDVRGECRAHGHLGAVHMSLGHYTHAARCYQEQLERARELGDVASEAQALGNLGIARLNMGSHSEAAAFFERQLAALDLVAPSSTTLLDKGRAYGNLGDCHDALGDPEEAIKWHEQHLAAALHLKSLRDQERAYRGLGHSQLCVGSLQQALVCFEKRLVVAHELNNSEAKASAYGELGHIHSMLGNYEQAISCLEHQMAIARELKDVAGEGEAASGLGRVYQQMGDLTSALRCHQLDLRLAEEAMSNASPPSSAAATAAASVGRACGNLGAVNEALGNLDEALHMQERHLGAAAQLGDHAAKVAALSSLGRIHHALGDAGRAVAYLEQGLGAAEQLGNREEEARIRHRLGLALWGHGDLNSARAQLETAAALLETVRREEAVAATTGAKLRGLGMSSPSFRGTTGPAASRILHHRQMPTSSSPQSTSMSDYRLALFDLQTASYQALQRVLVALGQPEEALLVAERARIRALTDLHLERQGSGEEGTAAPSNRTMSPSSVEQLVDLVNRQRASVLYFSLAAGYLYAWFIVPTKGIVRFNEIALNDDADGAREEEEEDDENEGETGSRSNAETNSGGNTKNILDHYIQSVRDTLRMELQAYGNQNSSGGDVDGELSDPWSQHLEELGDRLNQDGDRTGFLRMVNRNHLFNSSNYSLSSLFSLGSVSGSVASGPTTSRPGSTRSRRRAAPLPHPHHHHQGGHHSGPAQQYHQHWQGPACLTALYRLLLGPFEDVLPIGGRRELLLVLEGDLYLVPFPVLRAGGGSSSTSSSSMSSIMSGEYLCERFSLIVVPSLTSLYRGPKGPRNAGAMVQAGVSNNLEVPDASGGSQNNEPLSALVVGNPRLPPCATEQWGWGDLPSARTEAATVAEMLRASPSRRCLLLCGPEATKESVLRAAPRAECIHLAAHVSWELSAIVVAPPPPQSIPTGGSVSQEGMESSGSMASSNGNAHMKNTMGQSQAVKRFYPPPADVPQVPVQDDESSEVSSSLDLPSLSEFLLTAADLLSLRLSARLVVIGSWHGRSNLANANGSSGNFRSGGWPSADGVVALTRALLAAGAACVLVSLWPVPEMPARILLRAFYSALLQGSRASRALAEAMQTVQHTKHFAHPANWAGFLLVGSDIRLSNKVALLGKALCELLKQPEQCRDALRVTLHLVEKSLQRIHRGQKNAMYTTQKSIENKVSGATGGIGPNGWRELLMSVGFRFEPAANGIPSSVFFPQSDPDERLTQCSASLQALLGLSTTTLCALSKLTSNAEAADDIIGVIRQAIGQLSMKNLEVESIEIPIDMKLWQVPGCHELLASLGFDLMEVGQDEVTLRTGKQANRRSIQFVLQALLALFDTQEAPNSLSLDSYSSLESLESAGAEEDEEPEEDEDDVGRCVPPPPPPPAPFSLAAPPPSTGTRRAPPAPLLLGRSGAFTNYVRRRGEPDGRTACPTDTAARRDAKADAEESLPIVDQSSQCSVALTLAHQTRIRSLYSASRGAIDSAGGIVVPSSHRPDSSSSASSSTTATDWESGHATVRRSQQQQMQQQQQQQAAAPGSVSSAAFPNSSAPPPPPPVSLPPPGPAASVAAQLLYDGGGRGAFEPHPASAPDFQSAYRHHHHPPPPPPPTHVKSVYTTSCSHAMKVRGSSGVGGSSTPDRLSVRTEVGPTRSGLYGLSRSVPSDDADSAIARLQPGVRTGLARVHAYFGEGGDAEEEDEEVTSSAGNASAGGPVTRVVTAEVNTQHSGSGNAGGNGSSIQDHIIATQLRRLNREMTPISDVYHERNLGLGLAPPLSTLLMGNVGGEGVGSGSGAGGGQMGADALALAAADEALAGLDELTLLGPEVSKSGKQEARSASGSVAPLVKGASSSLKLGASGTWLGLHLHHSVEGEDCVAQVHDSKSSPSGSELSRRDEGDGRSIADSQCSAGSYKTSPSYFTTQAPAATLMTHLHQTSSKANHRPVEANAVLEIDDNNKRGNLGRNSNSHHGVVVPSFGQNST